MARLIPGICFAWALYQLYIASPLPFMLTSVTGIDFFIFIGNLSVSRKIHLIFALVLSIMAFPMFKSSNSNNNPDQNPDKKLTPGPDKHPQPRSKT